MKTFINLCNLTVPQGDFFYPCSGYDTLEPLETLHEVVTEFHFADTENFALPEVRSVNETLRPSIIKTLSLTSNSPLLDYSVTRKEYLSPDSYQEIWEKGDRVINIYWHKTDARAVLNSLKKIAVFYYRGDSIDGAGSGIYWLGEILFNQVLEKLLSGGLIITDGSNPDENWKSSPWRELFLHSQAGSWRDDKLITPQNFKYRNLLFTCLGSCGKRYGTVYAWQVTKLQD